MRYLITIIILTFCCFNAEAAVKVSTLDKGLVGHWTLAQESLQSSTLLADKTPYQNNGTSANAPTFTTDQHGQANKALSFNGTNNWVEVADSPVLDTVSSAVTVSAWVYRNADQSSWRPIIAREKGTGSDDHYYFGFYDNQYRFYISTTGGTKTLTGSVAPNSQWIHVAATYDGTNVKYYVNGLVQTAMTTTHSGTFTVDDNPITIGCDTNDHRATYAEYLNAVIADVRIYNRALSATEVAQLYSAYLPKYQVSSLSKGLVGHWKLSQASKKGALYGDATPYNNDGTATGTSATTDRHGQANKALSFNGSSDYVLINGSSVLKPTTQATIAAWVYPTATGAWKKALIFPYGDTSWTAPYYSYQMAVESNNPHVGFSVDGDYTHGGLKSGTAFTLNTWTHVVGTFNSGIIKLYVNGSLDSSKDVTAFGTQILYTTRVNPVLGRDADYFNLEQWSGRISDVRIYNRALSQAEVTQLYNEYR